MKPITDYCKRLVPVSLTLILTLGCLSHSAIAQRKSGTAISRITGTITEGKTGQPVSGASILLAGTTSGTTSDSKGTFHINGSDTAVLLVSYTGYAVQRISVNGRNNITVTLLEDATKLNDVVVVGYGNQKKNNLIGSVSAVQGEELVKSNAPSLSNSLGGRVPGIISIQRSAEPGDDDAELLIRGRSTLNDNGPLIMVDGIQRDFSQIDPNEIASVSVLKDASATAIYGTRGANGVILVTTKRGVSGKPTFNYNGYAGFQNVTKIPPYLDAYDFARSYNQAMLNDNPTLTRDDLLYSDEDLQQYKDHSDPYGHPDINWYKQIIQPNALQQRHSLSMTGGSDRFRYFMLFGYMQQQGIYRSDNLKKYNFRINMDADLTKTTTLSLGVASDMQHRKRPGVGNVRDDGGIFSVVTYLPPNAFPIKNKDGTWASLWGDNPVADLSVAGSRDDYPVNLQTSVTANQKLDFITRGLSFKAVFGYDFGYYNYNDWYTPYISYLDGEVLGGGLLPSLYEGYSKYNNTTFEGHLNYARSFGRNEVTGLVLYTQSANYASNIDASRTDFASPAVPRLFAGPRTNLDNYGGASESGREGVVGRFTYAYDKKYLLEASFGYNGSENFPPGHRFGFFPALAVGWNIRNEDFLKDNTFISNLKLRGSYGEVGNDRVGYGSFLYRQPVYFGDNYVFGGSAAVPVQTLYPGSLANQMVTWERAKKTNIGLDADFKNYVIGFNIDVFYEKRDNILANRNQSVPQTFGATLPVENIGKVSNHGVEAQLRYKDKIGALNFFATLNYTFARNKIDFIDEAANIPSYQQRTGHPIGQFFGYVSEGLYQSQDEIDTHPKITGVEPKLGQLKYKDINHDGAIDALDITAIGKSETPQSIYGLNLGAECKGFDLSLLLQGASGYNVMRNGESFTGFTYGGSALSYVLNNWTPENPKATFPRLSLEDYNYKQDPSSFWLHNAGYLRLKNLELGYTFPKKLFGNSSISKLRVYVSGTNLLTYSKEKYFDPESASGYPYYYPVTRLTTVGVNLSF